jgi:putative aldouronate transport system substrate-binding protein
MKKTTFIVSILTVTALATVLSACSQSESDSGASQTKNEPSKGVNPSGFPIVNQPITLKMVGAKEAFHADWDKMFFFQEYEKMTNVKFQFATFPKESYEERKNILLATSDLPDIFFRGYITPKEEITYGNQGVYIPLNDLIDKYAPNLKALNEKDPSIFKNITQPDGKIYSLPAITGYPDIGANKAWINKKWLDKLGLAMPTTTDEYYKVLKAFKEGDPNGNGKNDELPITGSTPTANPSLFFPGLQGAWGLGTLGGPMADSFIDASSDGKLRFFAAEPQYKELLQYMNKLWSEKLIDPEILTQKEPQFTAKGDQGIIGSFIQMNNPIAAGPKYSDDYVPMPVLKGPHGDKLWSNIYPAVEGTGTFVITSKNKYPEASMRWVDYFYGDEGVKFWRLGIENKTFKSSPDGSYTYIDDIQNNTKGLTLTQSIGQHFVWPGGGFPTIALFKYKAKDKYTDLQVEAGKMYAPSFPKQLPRLMFTKEETDELSALQNDINTYVNEMRLKFVTGVEPFSNWDNYTSRLKQMKVDKLVAIHTTAYERWKKN